MSNVNQYLRHLAGSIGPRPASSDTEKVAADWVFDVLQAHGLQPQVQDFETPRSSLLATAAVNLVFVLAVAAIGAVATVAWLAWILWVVIAGVAVCTYLSARGRACPSLLMPKGPSQNVVARWAPHAAPGERRRKIVLVAGLDTGSVSPLAALSGGAILRALRTYTRYYLYAAPVLALVFTLPFKQLGVVEPWLWWAMLVLSIAPLTLAVNAAITPLFKRYSPGANANASGVAALLGVLDDLVGEAPAPMAAGETGRVASLGDISGLAGIGGAQHADVFADDQWGAGSSSGGLDLPDDFAWASAPGSEADPFADDLTLGAPTHGSAAATGGIGSTARSYADAAADSSTSEAPTLRGSYTDTFETIEFAAVPEEAQQTISFAPVAGQLASTSLAEDAEVLGPDVIGLGKAAETVVPMDFGERGQRKSLLSFLRRGDSTNPGRSRRGRGGAGRVASTASPFADDDSTDAWLGMGSDFSATSAGNDIGSWDNFADDDGMGWKGGWAEGDVIEDAQYAEAEAARIRRRVSESTDGSLSDKEVWFLAAGASAAGGHGMREFLREYAADLKGASFINIECVGAGSLHWYSSEGIGRELQPSSRLISVAKRASRELDLKVKGAAGSRRWTDAAVVLRGHGKAVTITRLGADGQPVGAGVASDTVDGVDTALIDEAVRLVAQMVRQY